MNKQPWEIVREQMNILYNFRFAENAPCDVNGCDAPATDQWGDSNYCTQHMQEAIGYYEAQAGLSND